MEGDGNGRRNGDSDGESGDGWRDGDGDGRHNGSATAMMAMDNATATGGKEEIMAGRGSASMLDAGELRRS